MKQSSYAKQTNHTPANQAENNECMIVHLKNVSESMNT